MMASSNQEQAIKALEAYRAELRTKLEQGKRDLDAVERSIQLLHGNAQGSLFATNKGQSTYAEMGPQAAVLAFFKEHPNSPFKPSEVAKEIISLGYQPTNPNRNIQVTQARTACLRLTEKKILEQTAIDGKTAFCLAKEGGAM